MKDDKRTKTELIKELKSVRRKMKKMETLLEKRKHTQQDITERKRVEEALRESETKYRSLFENSLMGISQVLPDGRLLFANAAYAQMYGYNNPEEMISEISHVGQQLYVNPEEREEVIRILKEKGVMKPKEMEVVRRDGTRFFILVSACEVRDSSGKLLFLQASHIDITDRKRAEQELRENAERLNHILEATSGGVWDWHIPSGAAVFSPGYARMLGYEPDEFARHYDEWGMIVHPDDIDRVKQHHSDHFNNNKEFSIEFRMKEKSGRWHWIHSRGILIERDSNGNPLRMVGTHSDIQGRKQAEEVLKENELKFRTVADFTYDWEYWENENRDIVYVSPSCERMTGYSRQEFIADPTLLEKIVHPEDVDYIKQHHERVFASEHKNDTGELEFRIIHKDGSVVHIYHVCRPVYDESNKYHGRRISNRDITERKQTEEELSKSHEELSKSHEELRMLANHLQNIREEERNHLAREFHDQIGQSMTALKMDLSLLLRTISDEKQDVPRKLVAEELQSMQKLVDETSQLLWAIITELRPQMLDDLGLVATLEWEAQRFESRTDISCEFQSSAGDIQIDSKKSIALFRIYQEALTNIIRHANATVVMSGLQRDGEMLVLAIKDNGCGISIDEQFKQKPFGLIGMRERALALGGQLEISGIAGEGTTIIVRLPL